jgi:uncharacterized membrane protein YgaE (UPF0421/DUF939 family)
VVPIQAGVSAVLITVFGPATDGPNRLLDVAVGAAVGLLFSQLLSWLDRPDRAKID